TVGPIVVHCSAGIGRTGTFCAVDCALKQFRAHIFKHVHSLKNQNTLKEHRTGMVQTEHQYEFVYKAVI
ncbi:predicted protein, partial [Naegleria gruberi]